MLLFNKIFSIALSKLSPKVQEWLLKQLTRLMDFLEKHFNNIVRHLFGIGGAGLAVGELANIADTIYNGCSDKFSWFTNLLALPAIFESLNDTLTPYMQPTWNCNFLQFFSAFGGITAINTIVDSIAYAFLFWLGITIFKYTIGLIPLIIRLVATKGKA